MPANNTNVIWAGGIDSYARKPLTAEGQATVAGILPGQAVAFSGVGFGLGTGGQILVAKEQGESFDGATITTPWTQNENMVAVVPRSGEFVYVAVAAGQTVTKGAGLVSNAGQFEVAGGGDTPQLYAWEESTAATANTLILAYKG